MSSNNHNPGTERLSWGILRPPPPMAMVFGAIYGAIAGAIVAWDIVVLVRTGKIVRARVMNEIERRRGD